MLAYDLLTWRLLQSIEPTHSREDHSHPSISTDKLAPLICTKAYSASPVAESIEAKQVREHSNQKHIRSENESLPWSQSRELN